MKKQIKIIAVASLILAFSTTSSAYLTINETAEILPENFYKIGVAPQLLISDGGGINVATFVDVHIANDTDGRITLGGGEIDFWTQATVKWVPFPDVDKQPAIGLRGGVGYARDERNNSYNLQIVPLLSKKADTRYGNMIPYVGFPITYIDGKYDDDVATQLTVGSEWFPREDRHIGAELNLNMNNSISSISVFFSFPFEGSTGYKRY